MADILTIEQYFKKGLFIIPAYQRGYKWGVATPKKPCAVETLMKNIISAFNDDAKEYFIQGVTVYEDEEKNEIHLIDGQQRTTTFFLLLHALEKDDLLKNQEGQLKIQYLIRNDSQAYLNKLVGLPCKTVPDKDTVQDIFYFDKALKTIRMELNKLSEERQADFRNFVLAHIKLLYITTVSAQATKTFSMLNGQKAEMNQEELIKAALLSKASRANHKPKDKDNDELTTEDWEINALREKYAREWDKWLYWWHRKEVKCFFQTLNPMGLLLEYYFYQNIDKIDIQSFNFKNFADKFLYDSKNSKKTFKALRNLQKTFEDWFNDPKIYNYLGILLKKSKKKEALLYLLGQPKTVFLEKIKEYTKWALIGLTHQEIIDENKDKKSLKAEEVLNLLQDAYIFSNSEGKEHAYCQLLRRNVLIDLELDRKFNFECWSKNRSLEHIFPQLKVSELTFAPEKEKQMSIHCIGNLVLLYGEDNSAFGALDFNEKKQKYFAPTPKDKNYIKSLQLMHSVAVFATEKWGEAEIEHNQNEFINEFKTFYNI